MRLIDADALLEHQVEADKMGAMLVVGKGFIMDAPTITPQPDPKTGLMPCGCGGKAEYTDNATAVCMWCGISTLENFNDADAAKVWNRAMGGDYTIKGIKPPEPDRVDNPPGFDSGRDN